MSKEEEAEQTDATINVTRYACMPSLVSLQQMRNRLQLSHLGKKLMKWTALATRRELIHIAGQLEMIYCNFSVDIGEAFMLLARGRYFYPNLNKMVIENVPREASVTVVTTIRPVSGVKLLEFRIADSFVDSYVHLGLDKGGQTIYEAKKAWLDLLRRMIQMLDYRLSFQLFETANRSATKKQNVLGKIVIPRTEATIHYIISELEEMARENFYRMKKIIEVKTKRKKKAEVAETPVECPVCIKMREAKEKAQEKCTLCGALLRPPEEPEVVPSKLPKEATPAAVDDEDKLQQLKAHISDIIVVAKRLEESGIAPASVEEFRRNAEILKEKLSKKNDETEDQDEAKRIPSDVSVNKLCLDCKAVYEEQIAAEKSSEKPVVEEAVIKEEVPLPEASKETIKTEGLLCELHGMPEVHLELGIFETDIQEITKITRVQNENGTISEEKKVVRIKKEVRAPTKPKGNKDSKTSTETGKMMYQSSDASGKSMSYAGSKTVGVVIMNSDLNFFKKNSIRRDVKSEVLVRSYSMADPMLRHCISFRSIVTFNDDNSSHNLYNVKTSHLSHNAEANKTLYFFEPPCSKNAGVTCLQFSREKYPGNSSLQFNKNNEQSKNVSNVNCVNDQNDVINESDSSTTMNNKICEDYKDSREA